MATYYYAQDGTAANKGAATTGAFPAGCMSIAVLEGETFADDDFVLASDQGGEIVDTPVAFPSGGAAGHVITYGAKDGETPLFTGRLDLTSATYKWTVSGSGTNEYYCELAAGGDPNLTDTHLLLVDDVAMVESNGTVATDPDLGSLSNYEWGYGDNDSLGYETFYYRDDDGDPDTSGVVITVPNRGCINVYQKDYVTVDGLTVQWGYNPSGSLWVGSSNNVTVQNCEAHWNGSSGIMFKSGSDYGTAKDNVASHNGAHNIGGGASDFLLFEGNDTSYARVTGFLSNEPFDGYGLKFLGCSDSVMRYNETYYNEFQGIDLDMGCLDNDLCGNSIHENGDSGILIEIQSNRNRVFFNRIWDNNQRGANAAAEVLIAQNAVNCEVFSNVIYMTRASGGNADALVRIINYSSGGCTGAKVYNNTLDGGGFAKRGVFIGQYDTPIDGQIFNNIIVGIAPTGYAWQATGTDEDSLVGFDADYNLMVRGASGDYIVKYGTGNGTQYTLAGIKVVGFEENGTEGEDPLFTDYSGHNYSLQAGSPCRKAASGLGSPYNVGILPLATWPNPETGDRDDY